MENVFADISELGINYPEREILEKPKRSVFVFITAELDSSSDALEDLKKIGEVKEVYLARGAYDIVAKISGDSFDHLREDVLKRIKNLQH